MTDYSAELIEHYTERIIRRSGYADPRFPSGYDAHRPSPPDDLPDAICLEGQVERPRLVVDLGSGTGLSTRAWADRADEVVGVEASGEMRALAEARTSASNVRYVEAFSHNTGLPESAADVVTCSQSLHWMEPEPTFAEVARILRPGGVFAAYDYDWPPVVHWEVDAAFSELLRRVDRFREQPRTRYPKHEHLGRIEASGHFRFAREIVLHSRDRASAERIVGMALSLGPLVVLLKGGMTEEQLGLAQLREVAVRVFGEREVEMFLGYRVRIGVK